MFEVDRIFTLKSRRENLIMFFAKVGRFGFFRRSVSCAVVAALLAAGPVYGHHSFQMFDMENTITLEGRLTEFDYTNPHAYLTLEANVEQGEVEVWEIETIAAIALRRRGIMGSDFAVGDWIRVEAHPPRNTERRLAAGEVITKLDGTELVVGFQGGAANLETPAPAVAAVATSISGIWRAAASFDQIVDRIWRAAASFDQIVDRAILDSWPLTEKGRDALARYDGSQTPSVNCVPYAAPAAMVSSGTRSVEIGETDVTIRSRTENSGRIIYVDGRSHPELTEPSNQGHSIGRWEDGVLVVDTIHFTEHLVGNAFGVPSGFEKHLTEQFALSEDGTEISYSFSIEDPEYLTGSVMGGSQWQYRPDLELETATCDPEAARRFLDAF